MTLAVGQLVTIRARVVQGPDPRDGRVTVHVLAPDGTQHLVTVKTDRVNCRDAILLPSEWCEPVKADEAGEVKG